MPTLIAYAIAFVVPFFMGLYLSFCKFKTIGNAKWVGLSNYLYVFQDSNGFLAALWFTVKIAVVGVIDKRHRICAGTASDPWIEGDECIPYRILYAEPDRRYHPRLHRKLLLNGILIKLTGADLTFSATYRLLGYHHLYNWQNRLSDDRVYIAGIQSISADLMEAAQIDARVPSGDLRKIIIPLVMPSITICSFLSLTDCFKMYDQNLALTGGAPGTQTAMLAMDICNTYYNRIGFAGIGQAKAVVFTVLVFAIAMVQLRATRSKEVE